MLTNMVAKAAAPQARAYKLFDGGGLHLHVAPTGAKSWRLKFRLKGREQLLTLGRFPDMPLPLARARRDELKQQLAQGRDPRGSVDIKVNSFEQLARAWHGHMAPRWSPVHAADVLASLERDVFPAIGARAPGSISASELLTVLRSVEARGAVETARRLRQRLSMVFGFAMSQDLCESDPAAMLGRAMQSAGVVQPHAALTDVADCRALLSACDNFSDHECGGKNYHMAALASRFLALTAVRLDAVRGARWGEIEGLDGREPLWRVPAARMKLARAKKGEARFDHLVPLSPQAVGVLRKLQPGAADLLFPGLGEGAIRALYRRAGFGSRHVPHGWRASFSTILNEAMPEWRGDIDRALAHAGKDKVEAAYNRSAQLGRRRALFDAWGEMLTPA